MEIFLLEERKRVRLFPVIFLIFFLYGNVFAISGEMNSSSKGSYFTIRESSVLKGHVIQQSRISSFLECGTKCLSLQPDCKSFNYIESPGELASCELNDKAKHCVEEQDLIHQPGSVYAESIVAAMDQTCFVCENGGKYKVTAQEPGFKCICNDWFGGEKCQDALLESCQNMTDQEPSNIMTSLNGSPVEVFCDAQGQDGGWTLAARVSNTDAKHWMADQGTWWYDLTEKQGKTLDPTDNADMISEAFWLQKGSEFKITRSDDPTHTALLTTTGNCLGVKTFREKMAGFGVFRGLTSWAEDSCQGSCSVSYAGGYVTTSGFSQAECDGSIQARNSVGFWCDHQAGDGSVIMIGGGGTGCSRADHGIGITEANDGHFQGNDEKLDFGDVPETAEMSYALNLWVR